MDANVRHENQKSVMHWVRKQLNDGNVSIWHTGGGCTAIHVPVGLGSYWLITDDAAAPDSPSVPVCVGLYDSEGERFVCFQTPHIPAALDLIRSLVSFQF